MQITFTILCLAVLASNEGLAENCEEDNIKQCLHKVGEALGKIVRIQESGEDLDNTCSTVEPEPKCLKDIPNSCKSDFSLISVAVSEVHLYKDEFCGENGRMYKNVAPCLTTHNAVFEKCQRKEVPAKEMMCELVDYMLCAAKFSKENCGNGGEAYGNALEARMKIKKAVCRSGASYLANSFWIFATTVLSVLLIKNKLQ